MERAELSFKDKKERIRLRGLSKKAVKPLLLILTMNRVVYV